MPDTPVTFSEDDIQQPVTFGEEDITPAKAAAPAPAFDPQLERVAARVGNRTPTQMANEELAKQGVGPVAPPVNEAPYFNKQGFVRQYHTPEEQARRDQENAVRREADPGIFGAHPAEAAGNLIVPGIGTAGRGAGELTQKGKRVQGAARVIGGLGEAGSMAAGVGAVEAPISTAVGLGTGLASEAAAGKAAEHFKASPETKQLIEEAGFWAPTAIGALTGLAIKPIGKNPMGVEGATAEMFGGRLKGAVVNTPQGAGAGIKVGGTSVAVGKVNEAMATMAQAKQIEAAASDAVRGVPPPPPPPPPGPEKITSKHVDVIAKAIQAMPEEGRQTATLEAHDNLTTWIAQRGKFVGPDGKIYEAKNPEAASSIATKIINDAVGQADKAAAELAKGQKAQAGAPGSRAAKPRTGRQAAAPATSQPSPASALPETAVTSAPLYPQQPEVVLPGGQDNPKAITATPPKTPPKPEEIAQIGNKEDESGRTILQPKETVAGNTKLAVQAAPELHDALVNIAGSIPGAQFERIRPQKSTDRANEKAEEENKPPETIPDYLGAQIAADTPQAKDQLVAELQKNFNVVEVEDKFLEGRPDKAGYPSTNVQIQMGNGLTSEVQIVPREVQNVSLDTHKLYTKGREAEVRGDNAERDKWWGEAEKINRAQLEAFKSRNGIGAAASEGHVAVASSSGTSGVVGLDQNVAPAIGQARVSQLETQGSSEGLGGTQSSTQPAALATESKSGTAQDHATQPNAITKGQRVLLKDGSEGKVGFAHPEMNIVRVTPANGKGKIYAKREELAPIHEFGEEHIAEPQTFSEEDIQEQRYKHGSTQANIPQSSDAAKALQAARDKISEADLAGDGKDIGAGGDHVTVRYGLDANEDKVRAFLETQQPFEAKLGKTSKFPPTEHSDGAAVIIAPIESAELHRINDEIQRHGQFAKSDFPEYKPHATVAFVKPEVADKYVGMSETAGKTFRVDSIAITDRNGNQNEIKLKGSPVERRKPLAIGEAQREHFWDLVKGKPAGHYKGAERRSPESLAARGAEATGAAAEKFGLHPTQAQNEADVAAQRDQIRELTAFVDPETAKAVISAHPEVKELLAPPERLASNKEAHETGRVSEEVQPAQRRQENRVPESGATPGQTGTHGEGSPAQKRVGEVAPGEVGQLDTFRVRQSPHRFQYKLNTDAEGVGSLLKTQKTYNPDLAGVISVWRDPADGHYYVVNGHHRLELAKRTLQKGVTVRHIIAKDAAEARATGALQNIAEGRGTPIDAAKFLRDTGITPQDLDAKGISMGEATAAKGVALSKLDDSIFNKVVQGDFPLERAVAIGEATDNHAEQKAIADLIDRQERKGKRVSNDTLKELVRFVKGSGQSEETTLGLFGSETVAKSHALEKAEVSAYIKQQLAKDKKLFGFVSKGERAEELERGNNIIDVKTSKALAEEATQGEEVYNKLSERAGPIADVLDDAAARIAGGENANAVKQEAYSDIRSELSATLGGGQRAGTGERKAGSTREYSYGAPEETAGYRNRLAPRSELGDSELSSWAKSRTLRISDGGKQSTLFGNDEPMYKLTRLDSEGEREHTLISQAQFDQARKQFPNFDKAARAFEQGVESVGPQTSLFETKAEKAPAEPDRNSGDLFRQEFNESLFRAHSGIPFDAIPAAAKYVAATIKNSDPVQNLKEFVADESAKVKQSRELQKGLYDLEGAYAADVLRAVRLFKSMPGDAIDQELIYHSLEDPKLRLTPQQELTRDVILKPLMTQSERIYKKLSDGGVPVENYVHRVVQGKGNFIDRLLEGSKGGPGNILSKRAGATKSRSMMALEDSAGNRRLVSVKGETVQLAQRGVNGEQIYKPAGKVETKDGDRVVSMNGKLWKLTQATTKEIEAGTDLRYYKNAAASTITSYLELRKAERAYDFLESLKADPKFQDLSWTKGKDGTNVPPKGWKATKLSQFPGYYFEPHQAEVLDWYWERIHHDVNAWDKLGRVMMTSIFYNPLLHVPNVAAAWAVEGGATRLAPANIKNAWAAGDRARKAVMELNDDYIQALEAGAPLQAYRPEADQLQKMFFEHLGDKMQQDTGFAAQMKEMFGSNFNPYAISHKITWGSNDIMLLQSIYEHMGNGDTMKEAIRKATEVIPDYRLPTRMFDSPATAKILSNRNVTMFMPYHYGVLKSAAKIAEGAAKGDKSSYDKLIALALLTYVLYPLLDKATQKMSGHPNAHMKRSGLAGLIDNVQQVVQGKKSPTQALQSVITPAIHTKTAIELGFNRDLYTGDQVYDPHAPAKKIAKQVGRKLVSTIGPADAALRAYDNKQGARDKMLWQQVGVTFPKKHPHR